MTPVFGAEAAPEPAAAEPLQNPNTGYPQPLFKSQSQPWLGLAGKMAPLPNHGEKSYKGSGRLKGRRALITGGSGGQSGAAGRRDEAAGFQLQLAAVKAAGRAVGMGGAGTTGETGAVFGPLSCGAFARAFRGRWQSASAGKVHGVPWLQTRSVSRPGSTAQAGPSSQHLFPGPLQIVQPADALPQAVRGWESTGPVLRLDNFPIARRQVEDWGEVLPSEHKWVPSEWVLPWPGSRAAGAGAARAEADHAARLALPAQVARLPGAGAPARKSGRGD
ncbi:hypothetical protein [Hymenobacter rigui]|uniref:Uncharacterized protein n=1 Tax=Hymenobacter rigui TaxID=334424 RepID=A0A3R9NK36_9BACT|nr:hypothetical protein [Hymenobacter rigui]RSK48928.1 hypothetical protein EI291_10230 [Hymenobacter rigui]